MAEGKKRKAQDNGGKAAKKGKVETKGEAVDYAQPRSEMFPDLIIIANDGGKLMFHRDRVMMSNYPGLKALLTDSVGKPEASIKIDAPTDHINAMLNIISDVPAYTVLDSWALRCGVLGLTRRYGGDMSRILWAVYDAALPWPVGQLDAAFKVCKCDRKELALQWIKKVWAHEYDLEREVNVKGTRKSVWEYTALAYDTENTDFWKHVEACIEVDTLTTIVPLIKHIVPYASIRPATLKAIVKRCIDGPIVAKEHNEMMEYLAECVDESNSACELTKMLIAEFVPESLIKHLF
ncbi:MAG: hypothetical protein KGL39_10885 [Patescibacteria group bacterium]|nr:hypothetical protein [Patescibacteria group bacterium]